MNGVKETSYDSANFKANPFENITEHLIAKHFIKDDNEDDHGQLGKNTTLCKGTQQQNAQSVGYLWSILNPLMHKAAKILRDIPLIKHCIGPPDETMAQINKLTAQQKAAVSYTEWYETSVKLDKMLNNNRWKTELETTLYDYQLVHARLLELREARLSGDYSKLLYIIRTTWTRNMANMDNINLYRHSSVGTKKLIEEYIEECELCLKDFAEGKSQLDDSYVLGMLIQTRKNYGRVAITMSGGGCFGLLEIGVFSTLLEMDLLPKIVSGSSSGSILSSVICSKTSSELLELLETLTEMKFEVFEKIDEPESFLVGLGRLLKYGTWFDNTHLQNTMKEFLGDLTFREAYNRTGRILNITVSPASVHEQPSLLNYLTAPNVLIWSAVCASCSLPGVFPSSTIFEKSFRTGTVEQWSNPMIKFVDGSVHADLPIKRLSEMFNVNHVIACQVNPHVVPFLKMSIQCVGGEIENEYSAKFKQFSNQVYGLISTEAMHYLEVLSEIGIATNLCTKLRSVLSQPYSGDITILPELRFHELNKLLANPTPEFILDALVRGARATWPKISIIKNHCSIEFSLDRCITTIRSRLISSTSRNLTNLPVSLIPADATTTTNNQTMPMVIGGKKAKQHQRRRSETLNCATVFENNVKAKSSYPNLRSTNNTSTPSRAEFSGHGYYSSLSSSKLTAQKWQQQMLKHPHGVSPSYNITTSLMQHHRNTISSLPTSPFSTRRRRRSKRASLDADANGTQKAITQAVTNAAAAASNIGSGGSARRLGSSSSGSGLSAKLINSGSGTSIRGLNISSNSVFLGSNNNSMNINNKNGSKQNGNLMGGYNSPFISKRQSQDDFNRLIIGTMDDDLTSDFRGGIISNQDDDLSPLQGTVTQDNERLGFEKESESFKNESNAGGDSDSEGEEGQRLTMGFSYYQGGGEDEVDESSQDYFLYRK